MGERKLPAALVCVSPHQLCVLASWRLGVEFRLERYRQKPPYSLESDAANIYQGRRPTRMKTTIARIETFPVRYATAGYFKFFAGPKGRPEGRPSVVVKITADNGSVGWGQSVPSHRWSYETIETVESTIQHYLGPELIGLDPFEAEAIHAAMQNVIANSFSTGQPICKAGLELALFDLTGKMLAQSATQRWQRQGRDKITLSWTVNVRSLAEAEAVVAQGRARGYRNFNVKLAPDPQFDLELCRIVQRLAPEGFLRAMPTAVTTKPRRWPSPPNLRTSAYPCWNNPCPPTGSPVIKPSNARARCRSSWTRASCRTSSSKSSSSLVCWTGRHQGGTVRRPDRGPATNRNGPQRRAGGRD